MPRSLLPALLLPISLLSSCGIFRTEGEFDGDRDRLRNLYSNRVTEMHAVLSAIPDPVDMKPVRERRVAQVPGPVDMKPVDMEPVAGPAAVPSRPIAVAQEPQPQQPQQPQEPVRHIDDREPQVTGTGTERAFKPVDRENRWHARVGAGELDLTYGGSGFSDSERALFMDLGIGPLSSERKGPGLDLNTYVSGNDLFEGDSMPAPGGLRPGKARAWGVDVFPHLAVQPDLGPDTQLTLKVGPFVGYQRVDHDDAAVARRWLDFGARARLEPEWTLSRQGDTRLSIFGRAGFDLGTSRFREEFGSQDAEENANRWQGELGAGFRLHGRSLAGELSYLFRHLETGSVTSPTLGLLDDVTFTTSAIFLGLIGRF